MTRYIITYMKQDNNFFLYIGLNALLVLAYFFSPLRFQVIGLSGTLSVVFLALTLTPWQWLKRPQVISQFFGKRRKIWGVTAGSLALTHGLLGFAGFGRLRWQYLLNPEIMIGFIAWLVMLALILTSNSFARTKLGNWWKRIQLLVWFIIPFFLAHANILHSRSEGVPAIPVMILSLLMTVYAIIYTFQKKFGKLALIASGLVCTILILSTQFL